MNALNTTIVIIKLLYTQGLFGLLRVHLVALLLRLL